MKQSEHRQAIIDNMSVAIEQQTTMAGAINTVYLTAGAGEPIILLHGGGAGAVTWYPAIGSLAQACKVIAPDIVGYGESDKPDGAYDRPYFSAWLTDFMDSIGVAKAHVIGLSQGGAIALQFALEHPDRVEKLVLANSGALGAKPAFLPLLAMVLMNTFPSAITQKWMTRYLLHKPGNRQPDHTRYSVEVLKQPGGKNAFVQGKGAAVSPMPQAELRQIAHPTLIVWGEDDKLFDVQHGKDAAKVLPNATYIQIEQAGHLPLMDQTEIFNRVVVEFLGV